jgi:hypothetical protein
MFSVNFPLLCINFRCITSLLRIGILMNYDYRIRNLAKLCCEVPYSVTYVPYSFVSVIKSVLFAKKKIVILVGLMSDAQSRPFAVEPQVMANLCTHLHQV